MHRERERARARGLGLAQGERARAREKNIHTYILSLYIYIYLTPTRTLTHAHARTQAEEAVAAAVADRAQRCATWGRNPKNGGRSDAVCSAPDASGVSEGGGVTCLCTFPWCSWLLPPQCRTIYATCVYEEFFEGYANVTYRQSL